MTDLTPTVAYLRERFTEQPRVALALGSGLGALADELEDAVRVPFADIPGFARSSVIGHKGVLVAGRLGGVQCVAMQGRYHIYEGHDPSAVVLPIRALAALGARTFIATNAAGGLNPTFRPGDLMVIDDHINFMFRNPLIGPVVPGETRFPDMSRAYDAELQKTALRVALERRVRVVRGVYLALTGPSYETPAEIRMFRGFGADAVGMSTVPEVIVARAIGLRVLGISLITNLAAGLSSEPQTHDEVLATAAEAAERFQVLVRGVLEDIAAAPDVEGA
ncbi:MAG TPA: purine-nucleoside phosphorylase [Longimicrobiales bacterium]